MRGGRAPSSVMISCSAAMRPMLARASCVIPAVCGLAITLGSESSGCEARGRLLVPYVEPGAGNAAFAQGLDQRRLVVDEAARGADEIGVRLHQRELARADHAARALVERAVQ